MGAADLNNERAGAVFNETPPTHHCVKPIFRGQKGLEWAKKCFKANSIPYLGDGVWGIQDKGFKCGGEDYGKFVACATYLAMHHKGMLDALLVADGTSTYEDLIECVRHAQKAVMSSK